MNYKESSKESDEDSMDGDNEFECKFCSRILSSKSSLKRHIEGVHDNVKRYKCTFCDFKSLHKHHIKEHMVRHKGTQVEKVCNLKLYY